MIGERLNVIDLKKRELVKIFLKDSDIVLKGELLHKNKDFLKLGIDGRELTIPIVNIFTIEYFNKKKGFEKQTITVLDKIKNFFKNLNTLFAFLAGLITGLSFFVIVAFILLVLSVVLF